MNRTALIVDDSRTVRRVLGLMLRNLGFDVCEAPDADEALTMLGGERLPPGVVLVDWNMPGLSGLDLVRRLRGDARFDATRLMMVTSESEPERLLSALEAGADEYVIKPFCAEAIREKLALVGQVELSA